MSHHHKSIKPYSRLDITVKVDREVVSLNIDRLDEEYIRAGAVALSGVLDQYRQRYGHEASDLDLLRYTALHFATLVEEVRIKAEDQALEARLRALKDQLDQALYAHHQER